MSISSIFVQFSLSRLPHPVRHLVCSGWAASDQIGAAPVLASPLRMATLPQEVFVIEAQLFEAGAGNISQFKLHLLRSAAGLAALGDVLRPERAACTI